jgi:hypothetical protein
MGEDVDHRVRDQAFQALLTAGEFLLEQANRTVPIEESILEGSGAVDGDRERLEVAVYYDTPYAIYQHEETDLQHDPGRRAKWLELTLQEQSDRIERIVANGLKF